MWKYNLSLKSLLRIAQRQSYPSPNQNKFLNKVNLVKNQLHYTPSACFMQSCPLLISPCDKCLLWALSNVHCENWKKMNFISETHLFYEVLTFSLILHRYWNLSNWKLLWLVVTSLCTHECLKCFSECKLFIIFSYKKLARRQKLFN